jgi:pimeloyl-ACP methyl ester carboxylesterase
MASDLTLPPTQVEPVKPVREYDIRGGGGITLHAREWGNPDGPPILFIHGWSQCDLCWSGQVDSQLAARFRMVTFDNRGHGMSEKPLHPGSYADEGLWADDLAAVIDQTRLERPVLVAWSYGGFIVTDYARAHGDAGIAGINLVDAAVLLRPPTFDHFGPGCSRTPTTRASRISSRTSTPSGGSCAVAPPGLSTTSSGAQRCPGTWSCHPRCGAR